MLPVVLRATYSVSNGLFFRGMNQSLRHLAVKRYEQKLLYSRSLFFLFRCLNYGAWRNRPSICGRWVVRILSTVVPYSPYLVSVAAFVFMRSKEKFDNDSRGLASLGEILLPAESCASAPGEAIVRQCLNLGKLSERFLGERFPRSHPRDLSTVAQRIDVAHARVSSRLVGAFYSIGDFLIMHMADIVGCIILSCAGINICLGENLIWSAIQVFFCFVCMGEHKPFWMNPTYDDGPLCTMAGGRMFRYCLRFALRFRALRYFMDYVHCGPFGKVWMCVDLVFYLSARLLPQWFTSCWDASIKWIQGGLRWLLSGGASIYTSDDDFNVVVDSVMGNERLETYKGSKLRVTKRLFTPFQCHDPCPDSSVRQLEETLLEFVKARLKPFSDSEEFGTFEYKALCELMEQSEGVGVFSKHVDTCGEGRESFERESKMILHICISSLQKEDLSPLKSLIERSSTFLASCPDEVKRESNDLYLYLCASSSVHIEQGCVGPLPLSERHKGNVQLALFQTKVLQISQQVRDRECTNLIAGLSLCVDQLLQRLSQIDWGAGQPFAQLGIDVSKEVIDLWKNVHYVAEMRPIFKRELGLITYSEGTCAALALNGPVSDSPLWNVIAVTCFKLSLEGVAKYRCAREIVLELRQAIMNDGDARIGLSDLHDAAVGLVPEEERLSETYWAIVAPLGDGSQDLDEYVKRKQAFIRCYLPNVLVELGMLEGEK